jgi:hypothetical protein
MSCSVIAVNPSVLSVKVNVGILSIIIFPLQW